MLNYNVVLRVMKEDGNLLCENYWKWDNPDNLKPVNYYYMRHRVYALEHHYDGWVEIYKVEELNGEIVETKLWDDKPIPVEPQGEETIAQYIYRVAGTLD